MKLFQIFYYYDETQPVSHPSSRACKFGRLDKEQSNRLFVIYFSSSKAFQSQVAVVTTPFLEHLKNMLETLRLLVWTLTSALCGVMGAVGEIS